MQPFIGLTATAAPLPSPNTDTDQILPTRFLRKPKSEGYENWLFYDARFQADGSENPSFVLNQAAYRSAQILVAAQNFGCGSAREGAVWGLMGYGFRAVIAPSFGDIFLNNALQNGLLPVVLPAAIVSRLLQQLAQTPGAKIAVDLESQTVTGPDGSEDRFEIDPFRKQCLLAGKDEIGFTLDHMGEISNWETSNQTAMPWLLASHCH